MKYHPIGADMKCPFCGRLNLVYKRPGLSGDVYRCAAETGGQKAHHRAPQAQRGLALRCRRGAEFPDTSGNGARAPLQANPPRSGIKKLPTPLPTGGTAR